MTYYSYTSKELSQLGLQENELAIYTGTTNPQSPDTLSPGVLNGKNAYVYIWQDGQPRELDACFHQDGAGLDVLEVHAGKEEYIFLRDMPSGFIQQLSGPPRPIAIANLGAIPLRVCTPLGKFTVHAGSALRLDESASQREKKNVLLAVSSRFDQPLKSAEIWDGTSWRRLNIRKEPFAAGRDRCFSVLDGSAIVQSLSVNGKREIFMMDSPEPDPDYEIYVATQGWDEATLCFNRSDYRDGRVVQRKRTIAYGILGVPFVYDLQKLKETQTQSVVCQCTVELPKVSDILEQPELTAETRLSDDEIMGSQRPLISDKLRKFLESEDEADEQPLESEKALTPEPPENFPE